MPETVFKIVDRETNKVVHEVRTTHQGSSLDKVRTGLHRKVDDERFRVEEHDA